MKKASVPFNKGITGKFRAPVISCTCHIFPDKGLQLLDLFPELPDQFHVRVLVDGRLVDDILRSVRVPERTERLAIVTIRRTNGCDHDSLRVTSE